MNKYVLLIISGIFLMISSCDMIEVPEEVYRELPDPPEYNNPVDSEVENPKLTEIINAVDANNPALILYAPSSQYEEGELFPLYLIGKGLDAVIGLQTVIHLTQDVRIVRLEKDSTLFAEGADGMAFHHSRLIRTYGSGDLEIALSRLGGADEPGFSGDCIFFTVYLKAMTSGQLECILRTKATKMRNKNNDPVEIQDYINTKIQVE